MVDFLAAWMGKVRRRDECRLVHPPVSKPQHVGLKDISKYDRGLLTVGKPPEAVDIESR
jgi:hypothetical protein